MINTIPTASAAPIVERDARRERFNRDRRAHWDAVAIAQDRGFGLSRGYRRRLTEVYRFVVPEQQRVLELGCARGDLLAALKPSRGVGIDMSPEMIRRAADRSPGLTFVLGDALDLPSLDETFDYIILSDLVNELWDVQGTLEGLRRVCHSRTRVIINSYSRLWELPLMTARFLGLAKSELRQNWLTVPDLAGLLGLAGFERVRSWSEVLWPIATPLIDRFFNRFLVRLWPFSALALTNFVVARTVPAPRPAARVSVIVPARNEAGNIPNVFARTADMGAGTELVFVEGHSGDGTYEAIAREIALHPDRASQLLRQEGVGKGDAVRLGFARATGEMLMILDADLTMPPEALPRFYDALWTGKADFVNGSRLVYPMEDQAMQFFNLIANKGFGLAFSWLLGQQVKDTLCGTKVLWAADYERIATNRSYFGEFDPFGDFDLLFGAAKLDLKIMDLPVRYRAREYGETNIHRWRHGALLLRMLAFAAARLKFV